MSFEPDSPKSKEKLRRILEAILRMTGGNFNVDLPVENIDDPLDGIASGVNTMAGRLQQTTVSRDYFTTIISSMPDSLIVIDRLGFVSLANDATAELLGTPLNLITGLHFSRICPALYQDGETGFASFGHQGKRVPLELEYVGHGNQQIPVLFSASALSKASDRGRGWICSAQDLRSRKALESKLRQKDHLLSHSAKMAALGEMAGGVAHEINNPLSIIAGRAQQIREMVLNGELDSGKILKTIERIEATTMRVAKIISGLRTFARDAEHDPFETVSLKSLIEETAALCRERFKNNSVDLRIEDLSHGVALECRSVQISQVLVNLLNNAFDAVQSQAEKWVQIAVRDLDTELEIIVTDSGPGIPLAVRAKIMQPFFSTKEVGKGTGLGLSIASGIIGAHGGSLTLDETSQTTCFVVRLPKRHAESQDSQAA